LFSIWMWMLGFGLLELVGALLVDGRLVGVPQAVAQEDLAVGGAGGLAAASAAGDGCREAECDQ
jgi:hypothetical protein